MLPGCSALLTDCCPDDGKRSRVFLPHNSPDERLQRLKEAIASFLPFPACSLFEADFLNNLAAFHEKSPECLL